MGDTLATRSGHCGDNLLGDQLTVAGQQRFDLAVPAERFCLNPGSRAKICPEYIVF